MTVLSPMRPEVYPAYVDSAIEGYAEESVASGRWPKEGAVERSRAEFDALLPDGLDTPDNHLFEIKVGDEGPTIGFIWFAIELRHGLRGGYVYDVEIKPEHRRQGHARRAFLALEPLAASLGLPSIGLHVFGHNPGAQALYSQLGYTVTGLIMRKQLGDPGR